MAGGLCMYVPWSGGGGGVTISIHHSGRVKISILHRGHVLQTLFPKPSDGGGRRAPTMSLHCFLFSGRNCEEPVTLCTLSNPCRNGGLCRAVPPSVQGGTAAFLCLCPVGYAGTICDTSKYGWGMQAASVTPVSTACDTSKYQP